ncbi:MAG: glycosyltransferase family 39 protein [Patescibacteria group bacterium]|nr:glycosyltransferase family 39 protein [Patescibacteria group bacterium]
MKKRKNIIILLFILVIGGIFRWSGLNWDQNFHLHPDERFLTMVGVKSQLPSNIFQYLDPQQSLLNPYNIDFDFYVYGHLPLTFNKVIAVLTNNDSYSSFHLQARFISGLLDLLTVIVIFKIGELLEKKFKLNPLMKIASSLVYALLVVPIQQSHYFTVDSFLSFFSFLSFYFALKYQNNSDFKHLVASAITFAFALSSKLTAILILPLLFWLIINANNRAVNLLFSKKINHSFFKKILKLLFEIAQFLFFSYLLIRIIDPYLFESSIWLNPSLSRQFLQNLKSLKGSEGTHVWYPPAIQWIKTKPIIFALKNIFFFGLGPVISLLGLFGLIKIFQKIPKKIKAFIKKPGFNLLIVLVWLMIYFVYQSTRFVKTIRYFYPVYPFFALIAGYGLTKLIKAIKPQFKTLATLILLGLIVVWPLSFLSIYLTTNPRVKASHWIYQHIPEERILLKEHWDDGLPLPISQYGKKYQQLELPVFDPDRKKKWDKMDKLLEKGDYYILSSARAWEPISSVPEKYPQMSTFYQNLLTNKTAYKKVAEFTSYPSLDYLGIPLTFNDDWAEEAFTVYDHPKVIILQKQK